MFQMKPMLTFELKQRVIQVEINLLTDKKERAGKLLKSKKIKKKNKFTKDERKIIQK